MASPQLQMAAEKNASYVANSAVSLFLRGRTRHSSRDNRAVINAVA